MFNRVPLAIVLVPILVNCGYLAGKSGLIFELSCVALSYCLVAIVAFCAGQEYEQN